MIKASNSLMETIPNEADSGEWSERALKVKTVTVHPHGVALKGFSEGALLSLNRRLS